MTWQSLGELMMTSAARHPERAALWIDDYFVSYHTLLHYGYGVANALAEVSPRRTAIVANRRFWSYAGIVGTLLAGHAYVPLNPRHPPDRLNNILGRADVGALILDREALAACRPWLLSRPPMTIIVPDGHAADWEDMDHRFIGARDLCHDPRTPDNKPRDGAYLLFTSGSTGEPKGVMVNHENVTAYLRTAMARYRLTPEDRATQLFDLTFDLSIHDLFVTWLSGATLYCPADGTRRGPYEFVNQHALTCWFSTPSTVAFMSRLRMLRPGGLPSLRWSLFCGEALPKTLAQQWVTTAANAIVENLYGPTEATIAITGFRLPADLSDLPDILPIGEPFAGQSATIEGDELMLGGSQVTEGYWRQPEVTAERFIQRGSERLYRTGDRATRTAHGLCFQGRLDRQVKILGNRVELFEVEGVLRTGAGCDSVAAIAWPIRDGIAYGVVAMVAEESLTDQVVIAECRRRLPSYMVPSRLVRVADWPLNSNGKTDYSALVAILGEV
jgi:amino acid adenylation domain-containing protein